MSSELDTVKSQVQQAASSISDAFRLTHNTHSNTNEKKQRLNALGVHASAQAMEQVLGNLQEALESLGTAESEAGKASKELQQVASTTPIPEIIPKLTSTEAVLGAAQNRLNGSAELVQNAKTCAEQVVRRRLGDEFREHAESELSASVTSPPVPGVRGLPLTPDDFLRGRRDPGVRRSVPRGPATRDPAARGPAAPDTARLRESSAGVRRAAR